MENFLLFVTLWIVVSLALFLLYDGQVIAAAWREPVLRRPILIIESDDWGPGPIEQANVLKEISRRLLTCSDRDGHPPVMTLGMVLAIADGKKIKATGDYHRRTLSLQDNKNLLEAIRCGIDSGVFTVQLHGMEHYWPPTLIAASHKDEAVSAWLARTPDALTEQLPSRLQSRWVDASVLPARELSTVEINQAVKEEIAAFQSIFGYLPRVVVPPTFLWTENVEMAWVEAGVEVIITPGRHYETIDETGKLTGTGAPIYNGQQSGQNGAVYLVRNDYFEPALGHAAEQVIVALGLKTRLGRPTLLEMHRFNFMGHVDRKRQTLAELDKMLQQALETHPDLAFLSTDELAGILKNNDPSWVEQETGRKIHIWLTRIGDSPRSRKLAWISGWIVPGWLVWKVTA